MKMSRRLNAAQIEYTHCVLRSMAETTADKLQDIQELCDQLANDTHKYYGDEIQLLINALGYIALFDLAIAQRE